MDKGKKNTTSKPNICFYLPLLRTDMRKIMNFPDRDKYDHNKIRIKIKQATLDAEWQSAKLTYDLDNIRLL